MKTECTIVIIVMVLSEKFYYPHASNEINSKMMITFIIRHVRYLNLSKNKHRQMSAKAVGMLTIILRYSVLVYSSSEICEIFMLKLMVNMKKKPNNIFTFIGLRDNNDNKPVLAYILRCQKLLDKSMIMGNILFYFATVLIIPNARALSNRYVHTAD